MEEIKKVNDEGSLETDDCSAIAISIGVSPELDVLSSGAESNMTPNCMSVSN
jgi:hypothetical protein